MNVTELNATISKEAAEAAIRQYRGHRGYFDKIDQEIESIYRAIARGKKIISVNSAIAEAGFDEVGRPHLAIARADCQQVQCWVERNRLLFADRRAARWKITIDMPGERHFRSLAAVVPRIPPQHRPGRTQLSGYHILWEADWTDIPADPYLLKRIGKDAWVVLAAWDLTPLEISVIRAHRAN